MATVVVCLVAFTASTLTFFSGFGLGTLLLPAFALFYPIELAVASTAVVHFLNGIFKLGLVGRHADRRTVLHFGIPAILAAVLGAWVLLQLSGVSPVVSYRMFGHEAEILPAKLVIGILLLLVTFTELVPGIASRGFAPKYLPLGGLLSGFFGGLSGMQGALRSAFLIKAGLSTEGFIATGVVIAVLIDVSRLGVYTRDLLEAQHQLDYALLAAAVGSAFLGAILGSRLLRKVTMRLLQRVVGVMLGIVAVGLISGLL